MQNLQKTVRQYLQERGWDNLRPGDVAKSISIEAAELLELFQWDNPTLEETKKDKARMKKIKKELADILIYCLDMTVLLELMGEEIILAKLREVKRKYPARLMRQRDGKEPGTDSTYWKAKNAHRAKKR